MDPIALMLGNLLVGAPLDEAALEIAMGGFRAEFLGELLFAVTGADPVVRLNGQVISPWSSQRAVKGDRLEIESGSFGAYHYLCLQGGVDVPEVLGSKSTYLRGRFGGFDGRPLRRGDQIRVRETSNAPVSEIPEILRPAYRREPEIRVVLGPQWDRLTVESRRVFLNEPYRVSNRSDRMGIMLEGPRLDHVFGPDIISEGIALGAVQVPGEGLPFILLADRPTTGGYIKPATVVFMDIPLVAQCLPGNQVRFRAVSLEEARQEHLRWVFRLRRFVERAMKERG